jgi:hypothetical protein
VVASLPLAAFVMFSGFLLRGDAEAQQALRLATALLDGIPAVGRLAATALFGTEGHRQILYVNHVATASMLAWAFTAEHARAVWPRVVAVVETALPIAMVSLLAGPTLHDPLDPVVKGPWYVLGLQEAFHWSSRPLWLAAAGVLILLVMSRLPRLDERPAAWARRGLAAAAVVYAVLTAVGVFFRGAGWAPAVPWRAEGGAGWRRFGLETCGLGRWWGPPASEVASRDIPVVLGRREGCLFCHSAMRGLSASHRAEAVGCASCHLGNPFSLNEAVAHAGMERLPGNLRAAWRTCGTPSCHPAQVERVLLSPMTTMAGVVSVDRAVFGGKPERTGPADVERLGRSGADSHVRQLCASCHLGAGKTAPGPMRQSERGGGCSACHVQYSAAATADLARRRRALPRDHPNVSMAIQPEACFGCHSRSGRISTSYEGWHEAPGAAGGSLRRLADGRTFVFVAADVHARSMTCVDCHGSREVMGDGRRHGRAFEAVRVACEDCHPRPAAAGVAAGLVRTTTADRLDAESRKIAGIRGRNRPGERFLLTANGNDPLMGTGVDADGTIWLAAAVSGRRLPMKPAAAVCVEGGGHQRLSCASCHAAWAPRCAQCHTGFDPDASAVDLLDGSVTRGAWVESAGPFLAVPPTLGVRVPAGDAASRGIVDPFIPGMVMTLDRNQRAGARPDMVFRRLYARAFPHTIGQSARSCRSCHADPVALGYGEGRLIYERVGDRGRWRFTPRFAPGPDGLPADAWTGFLEERTAAASTRDDVRPFTVEEQKRILTVGACLTCHEPAAVPAAGFQHVLSRMTAKCLAPKW